MSALPLGSTRTPTPEVLNALHWIGFTGKCDVKTLEDEHFYEAERQGYASHQGIWDVTKKGRAALAAAAPTDTTEENTDG